MNPIRWSSRHSELFLTQMCNHTRILQISMSSNKCSKTLKQRLIYINCSLYFFSLFCFAFLLNAFTLIHSFVTKKLFLSSLGSTTLKMSDAASETQIRHAAHDHDNRSSIVSYEEKPRLQSKYRDYMNPRRRKYWYLCVPTTIVITILVVVLVLFVAFPKIAQNTINGSSININSAQITFPNQNGGSISKRDGTDGNSTFNLAMESSLSNTGPFSATITFDTIDVYYNGTILVSAWYAYAKLSFLFILTQHLVTFQCSLEL